MSKEEFVEQMRDVLQTDVELTTDTVLANLDEWDSLAMMATMAFIDKNFGIPLKIAELKSFSTVGDIAAKVGI